MDKAWDFKEQLKVGSRGEELFLEKYPRKLKVHPGKDGDFIVQATGDKIELKTDTYNINKSENFFIERWSDYYEEKPGSLWQARDHGCTIFCYYFVRHNLWYEFRDIPALINRIEELTEGKGFIMIKNKCWITAGWKVRRDDLVDLGEVYEW